MLQPWQHRDFHAHRGERQGHHLHTRVGYIPAQQRPTAIGKTFRPPHTNTRDCDDDIATLRAHNVITIACRQHPGRRAQRHAHAAQDASQRVKNMPTPYSQQYIGRFQTGHAAPPIRL